MREMLAPHRQSSVRAWATTVGLITDADFPDGTYGMVVGHVAPEAAVGGSHRRWVQEGDRITSTRSVGSCSWRYRR